MCPETSGAEAGVIPASVYREIWSCDFEFQLDGGLQCPLCLVAREYYSGTEIRMWRDAMQARDHAPFETGPTSLFVAFMAAAELHCFAALGWPMPLNVLDLCQEHKQGINYGRMARDKVGWGLVDALRIRGLAHAMVAEKSDMITRIIRTTTFTESDRIAILDYCAADVVGLESLLKAMWSTLDLPRAVGIRGRYMRAVACMEHVGIPVDVPMFNDLLANLPSVKRDLIAATDRDIGVYDGTVFKLKKFEQFLVDEALSWERTPEGRPKLDDDYLKLRADGHPKIRALHELRGAINVMSSITASRADPKVRRMAPSQDGFARCSLWAFGSATGRNQPLAREFLFGPARWLRGLIKPPPGFAVAYIDWSSQEFALAAALSGDRNMIADYQAGDVYWAFAQAAGQIPTQAVRRDKADPNPPSAEDFEWEAKRDASKAIVLGIAYGKGRAAIARDANLSPELAKTLYAAHKKRYARYWEWIDSTVHTATMTRCIQTRLGWQQLINSYTTDRTLMNFPMQANGAHCMQLAAIAATEAGIQVCAPVHDAFLILAPVSQIDAEVERMQEIMRGAGAAICGLDIRTDVYKVVWPDRFMDKRGKEMWQRITGLLAARHPLPLEQAA